MKFEPKGSTEEVLVETVKGPKPTVKQEPQKESIINDGPKIVTTDSTTSQFEVAQVPSQFKPYPKNTRIFANSYNYREVKFLSDSKIPLDRQYEIMLSGIEILGEMSPRDLTFFDFIYVSILRKLSSLGAQEYRVPYFCDVCDGKGLHSFTLEDIGFKTLDVELPVKVMFYTIGEQKFVPLTVGGYIELYREGKLWATCGKDILTREDGSKVVDPISVLAKMCISTDYEEIYGLLSSLKEPEDLNLLEDIEEAIDHYMRPLRFDCGQPLEKVPQGTHPSQVKSCKNKISVGLLGGESIIIPFRKHGEPTESRISFGTKGSS